MRTEDFVEQVVAGLAADDAPRRAEAADSVTDGLGAFSEQEADRIARTLVTATAYEADEAPLEAQLHALDALVSCYPIAPQLLAPIMNLQDANLGESELEYLEALREHYESGPGDA